MKAKKITILLGFFVALLLIVVPKGWSAPVQDNMGPVITKVFAAEAGQYGYIWRIYLEADDSSGEMLRIASVVDQPGYGRYPTDWIYIKPAYKKHFVGYIQWNTFSNKTPYLNEWTPITLTITIQDKSGRESNVAVFPFTFETGVTPPGAPPAPFDQANLPRLGYVMIDLFNPANLGSNGFTSN
jgi:hypothetical protein